VKQGHGEIRVTTRGKGLYDITRQAREWVAEQGIGSGLLTVFVQHTSASLTIQENADPDVLRDLAQYFERAVPEGTPWFRHTAEGPDDMPAHIRATLTSVSLSIPILQGRPALGIWQAIYLFEHRTHQHRRRVLLHAIGEQQAM
jgi:secondary thiamine-phosphate synthase enzyme